MAVLNTPHQVVPVRTHCHPLIGSFLIPPTTRCQRIDGEVSGCQEPARPHWHRIKAGTNAARRQSGKPKHTQAQEHPKTWPHSSRLYHRGVIGTWAFQSVFKGGNLIHMCTMKLAILYPAPPPSFSPSPSLQPYHWFSTQNTSCFSHILSISYQLPLDLSLWNRPRFDHDVWGCEGGQGCLIFTRRSAWQDFDSFEFFLFVAMFALVCVLVCLSEL